MDKIVWHFETKASEDRLSEAREFARRMAHRRSIREFDPDVQISDQIIEACIQAAAQAPSGANRQPWHFAVVKSHEMKLQLRDLAEEVERDFYTSEKFANWRDDIQHISTGWSKPHFTDCSHIIVPFMQMRRLGDEITEPNYYPKESVGLATGFLLAALELAGTATLVHTPHNMNFLNSLLGRPNHERAFVLVIVGAPRQPARVPNLTRKTLAEISSWY
ncbi:MAG TPA: nitroreductase family protein [Pseudobdellovibrionaceae bacterium]|nr:nitroreductase family protein [Pseudobdellovibrionaceae bacterium]